MEKAMMFSYKCPQYYTLNGIFKLIIENYILFRKYKSLVRDNRSFITQVHIKMDTVSFHMDSVLSQLQDMEGRGLGDTTGDTCACKIRTCQWPIVCHTTLRSCGAPGTYSMVSTLAQSFYHRNTCRLKEWSVIMSYNLDTSILHPWKSLK